MFPIFRRMKNLLQFQGTFDKLKTKNYQIFFVIFARCIFTFISQTEIPLVQLSIRLQFDLQFGATFSFFIVHLIIVLAKKDF